MYVDPGLHTEGLTSCHLGGWELASTVRTKKKQKKPQTQHSRLNGRRARKGNTSSRKLAIRNLGGEAPGSSHYQSHRLLTLISDSDENNCWEISKAGGGGEIYFKCTKSSQFLLTYPGLQLFGEW